METKEKITSEDITNHPNWLSTLTYENIQAHVVHNGDPLRIYLFWNNELIFEEDTYIPPLSMGFSRLDCMVDVLVWLTFEYDEHCEITKNYNEAQKKWSESDICETLRFLVNDYENREEEHFNDAKIALNAGFYHC